MGPVEAQSKSVSTGALLSHGSRRFGWVIIPLHARPRVGRPQPLLVQRGAACSACRHRSTRDGWKLFSRAALSSGLRGTGKGNVGKVGRPAGRPIGGRSSVSFWTYANLSQYGKRGRQQNSGVVQFTLVGRCLVCSVGCQGCSALGSILGGKEMQLARL